MTCRALFCSNPDVWSGEPASWRIRGLDLVRLRPEWRAVPLPDRAQIELADVVVVVKYTRDEVVETARALGKPVLWDFTDVYGQVSEPADFARLVDDRRLFRIAALLLDSLPADAVIVGSETMGRDLAAAGARTFVIPHHFWPGQKMRTEVSEKMTDAVYDGEKAFLSHAFIDMLRSTGRKVGLERLNFTYNTPLASRGDVAVSERAPSAMRWLHLRWKPSAKPVNALAAGLPIVIAPEAGALEILQSGHVGILPFADEDTLFDALVTAAHESFRRDVLAAAPAFRERFCAAAICRRYDEMFDAILRG